MTERHTQHYDVIIVGGGIVGLAMAARLGEIDARSVIDGQPGLTIAVIDNAPAPVASSDGLGLRTTSLNEGATALLTRVGALSHIPAARQTFFDRLEAGDERNPAALSFASAEIGLERFGIFVENDRLRFALWQCLNAHARVTLESETSPVTQRLENDNQHITLKDGRSLKAKLLIGADGAQSCVRHSAGIGSMQRDYAQNAMVINVRLERMSTPHTTWQVFTPHGPVAFLPLHDRQASLVWYDRPETAQRTMALNNDALRLAITEAFPARLDPIEQILGHGHFPMRRQHARRYVGPRLALVGDAAHGIHTLAGQGVNLGLADVEALGRQIEKRIAHGDAGGGEALQAYERHQWPRNAAMVMAVEQLHDIFTLPFAPLRNLAGRGLGSANRFNLAKRLMMKVATGHV
ncbi:FAD-dependent monooxygenase [Phytohalomonas tamaricis]|uniref:FAD-dependent monooxygenase n=1 Tax=Phytohalomonas tamaricis TaxID=2081032 RepID=UPI000D0ADAFE|nr:FAD-dependent monooxygenase [Phytohalomonas tamaricis]